MIINNGTLQDNYKIEFDDGYQMGFGVFETILVKDGKCLFLKEHLDRMKKGLNVLDIHQSLVEKDIQKQIDMLNLKNCAVKIMASQKNLMITHRELTVQLKDYQGGFSVKLSECIQDSRSHTSYIKSFNRIDQQIELKRAIQEGYRESLFLNENQFLTEGCISNLFFVKDMVLFTPAQSCGLLGGIVRQWVLNHFEVKEGCFTKIDLLTCDEAFLTNSLMGIMGINRFQHGNQLKEFKLGTGTKTFEIQQKYQEFTHERSL